MLLSIDYKPYVAVIGDIKHSKQLHNRNDIQKQLQHVLAQINQKYTDEIASNFIITLGDEFQGLLKTGAPIVYIIDQIEREMHPVELRFGLGVGEITTDILSSAFGADGPAYHLAREMIETLKSAENGKQEIERNIKISIRSNAKLSSLLNTLFSLLYIIKEHWTSRQVEIINAYQKSNSTQTATAKALHINQSNVQRALASSNYYTYWNALQSIADLLSEIQGGTHV